MIIYRAAINTHIDQPALALADLFIGKRVIIEYRTLGIELGVLLP